MELFIIWLDYLEFNKVRSFVLSFCTFHFLIIAHINKHSAVCEFKTSIVRKINESWKNGERRTWTEWKVFNWITYRVLEMCFWVVTSFGRKQTEVITVITVNAMCNYRGIGFSSKYLFLFDCRVNFRGDGRRSSTSRDWSSNWHWTRMWISNCRFAFGEKYRQ